MFKTLADYFKFIPGDMDFIGGGIIIAYWICQTTQGDNLWFFLIPLLYLSYMGYRSIILLTLSALISFAIYNFYTLQPGSFAYKTNISCIFFSFFYLRDMYFIWKYRLNAFTYSAKTEESRKRCLFLAKLGFIIIFSLCLFFYLLNLLYYSRL